MITHIKQIFGDDHDLDCQLLRSRNFRMLLKLSGEQESLEIIETYHQRKKISHAVLVLRWLYNIPTPFRVVCQQGQCATYRLDGQQAGDNSRSGRSSLKLNFCRSGSYKIPLHKLDIRVKGSGVAAKARLSALEEQSFEVLFEPSETSLLSASDRLNGLVQVQVGPIIETVAIRILIEQTIQPYLLDMVLEELYSMYQRDPVTVVALLQNQLRQAYTACTKQLFSVHTLVWRTKKSVMPGNPQLVAMGIPDWVQYLLVNQIDLLPDQDWADLLFGMCGILREPAVDTEEFCSHRQTTGRKFVDHHERPLRLVQIIHPGIYTRKELIRSGKTRRKFSSFPVVANHNKVMVYRFWRRIVILRNFPARDDSIPRVVYRDDYGWHQVVFREKKKERSLTWQTDQEYDWKGQWLQAGVFLRLLGYMAKAEKQDLVAFKIRTVEAYRLLIKHGRFHSPQVKAAARGLFLALSLHRQTHIFGKVMAFFSAFARCAPYLPFRDLVSVCCDWLRKGLYDIALLAKTYPLSYLLTGIDYQSKYQATSEAASSKKYTVIFHCLERDLSFAKKHQPQLVRDIWQMHQLITKLDGTDDELTLTMIFNHILAAEIKWRRSYFARFFSLFPRIFTAELLVTHFLLEDFDAVYLDDYYHILKILPIESWQSSELAASLIQYFSSCDSIAEKWQELFTMTDWAKQANFRLTKESLSDEPFFLLFNQCQTVSRALYKEGYRRLSNLKLPYSANALIALYRLNTMVEICLDEQNMPVRAVLPASVTLLYQNRSSFCEPVVLWPDRPTIACLTDHVQGVLINHDNRVYAPSTLLRKNAYHVMGRYSLSSKKLYQHPGLNSSFLDFLSDNAMKVNWPYSAATAFRYLQEHLCFDLSEDQLKNMNWNNLSHIGVNLLSVYRVSSMIRELDIIFRNAKDDSNSKDEIGRMLSRLNMLRGVQTETRNSIAYRHEAVTMTEKLTKNQLDEIDFRKYIYQKASKYAYSEPVLLKACADQIKKTGLYAPYGAYLVSNWQDVQEGLVEISTDQKLVQMLYMLTSNDTFRIQIDMVKDHYSKMTAVHLARIWKSRPQITDEIKQILQWVLFRVREEDISIIEELLLAYVRHDPKRYLYVSALAAYYQNRGVATPEPVLSIARQERYKQYLSLRTDKRWPTV